MGVAVVVGVVVGEEYRSLLLRGLIYMCGWIELRFVRIRVWIWKAISLFVVLLLVVLWLGFDVLHCQRFC